MVNARERMKELRQRKNLNQRAFAKLCDKIDKDGSWPQSRISRLENAKLAFTVEDLSIIVRALGTTLPKFFGASD